jgi:ribA/ribD-fused uncharacterized protein
MTTDKFVFFYGGYFSQWYPQAFDIDGVQYNCAEQYMMAMKAITFNDQEALTKIMASGDPSLQKATGRLVKNFDPTVWNPVAKDYVYKANMAKFTANPKLFDYILSTGDREIVEASPTDKIWGIGMDTSDPDLLDKSKWRGTNWLGEVLMQVRNDLRSKV